MHCAYPSVGGLIIAGFMSGKIKFIMNNDGKSGCGDTVVGTGKSMISAMWVYLQEKYF